MSTVIYFFKWILRGIGDMASWLVSIPSILVASIVGMFSSVSSLVTSIVGDSPTLLSDAVSSANSSLTSISNVVSSFPDIVKVGFYALSIDVAFRFVLAALQLFVVGAVLVLQFQLVTVLGYNLIVVGSKMVSWFIISFFPSAAAISGISKLSSADFSDIDSKVP